MGTVTPVMGKELGNWVVMSVNKSIGGGWRWFGWMGWWSQFPVVVRIPYDGFLLGFGVVTPETG